MTPWAWYFIGFMVGSTLMLLLRALRLFALWWSVVAGIVAALVYHLVYALTF